MKKNWAAGVMLALAIGSGVGPVWAEDVSTDVDLSKLDSEGMRELCERYQKRIKSLEAELAGLRSDKAAAKADAAKSPVDEGSSWVVKIESNSPPDIKPLQKQIDAERARLNGTGTSYTTYSSEGSYTSYSGSDAIESRLNAARDKYARMSAERTTYYDNNGKRRDKSRYSEADLSEAKQNVDKLEGERRGALQKINKLETQIRELQQARTVSASLPDGSPMILRSTAASADIVGGLVVGKKYRVVGVQVTAAKITTVTVKAAAVVAD